MATSNTLPFYSFSSIPTDFLAHQHEVGSKEGLHYYFPPGQHFRAPDYYTLDSVVVGFTVRLFCFYDSSSCVPVVTFYWKNIVATYKAAVGIDKYHLAMHYQKHTGPHEEVSNIKVEKGTYMSIAVRVKDTQHLSVFYNRREFNWVWVKDSVNTYWIVSSSSPCPTLSYHITRETEAFPYGYWRKQFYLKHIYLPNGTIGVFTVKLIDNTAKNIIYLSPDYSEKAYPLEFSHGSLPNGTLLQYTVRLTSTESIVTASFDRAVHRVGKTVYYVAFIKSTHYPRYINASFSSAVHPLTLECKLPYYDPPVV